MKAEIRGSDVREFEVELQPGEPISFADTPDLEADALTVPEADRRRNFEAAGSGRRCVTCSTYRRPHRPARFSVPGGPGLAVGVSCQGLSRAPAASLDFRSNQPWSWQSRLPSAG